MENTHQTSKLLQILGGLFIILLFVMGVMFVTGRASSDSAMNAGAGDQLAQFGSVNVDAYKGINSNTVNIQSTGTTGATHTIDATSGVDTNTVNIQSMGTTGATQTIDATTDYGNVQKSIDINSYVPGAGSSDIDVQKSYTDTGVEKSVQINRYGAGGSQTINIYKDATGNATLDINSLTPGGTSKMTVHSQGSGSNLRIIDQSTGSVVLDGSSGSLSIQAQKGRLTPEAKSVVLNLAGGTSTLIVNKNDFDTYKHVVIEARPAVVDADIDDDGVEVIYKQPGRFLGIFRATLRSKVLVKSNGIVKVDLPWYSFLFSKDTENVKASVQMNLSNAGRTIEINKVASGNQETVRVQNAAKVVDVVSATIQATHNGVDSTVNVSSSGKVTYVGQWNGRFTPASAAQAAGCPGGRVSFNVGDNGNIEGVVYIDGFDQGPAGYGGLTVDDNGNVSGGWSIAGDSYTASGKLDNSANTGSGTYSHQTGCYGTWSVSK